MELVEDSSYRNDLTEQDVLELIPRGLGLEEVEGGGHWLGMIRSCHQIRPHRRLKGRRLPLHNRHRGGPLEAMITARGPQGSPTCLA